MKNIFLKMWEMILWCLRIPESLLSLLSGAIISYSINIFTNQISANNLKFVAWLFLAIAVLLVLWVLLVKPFEENYRDLKSLQEDKQSNEMDKLSIWRELLNQKIFIQVLLLLIVASIIGLIIVAALCLSNNINLKTY